jgi:hypothetical protein
MTLSFQRGIIPLLRVSKFYHHIGLHSYHLCLIVPILQSGHQECTQSNREVRSVLDLSLRNQYCFFI